MKKTIQVAPKQEVLSLISGVTYARVPAWYDATKEDLKMDVIMPKHWRDHDALPAILWLCGGAFCVVDRSVWLPQMMDLARRGYVIASVNYRTSNAVSFPEPLRDVKEAIRFLRANAREFCIDPNRIAVMGESAGGTMASLAGVTADMPEYEIGANLHVSSGVQAVVDIYGLTDMRFASGRSKDPNVADWTMPAFLGGEDPERAHRASAINYVSEKTPPFFILHGSEDITVDIENSESMYQKLTACGVTADFYTLAGAQHGDDRFYQEEVYDLIDEFLKRVM